MNIDKERENYRRMFAALAEELSDVLTDADSELSSSANRAITYVQKMLDTFPIDEVFTSKQTALDEQKAGPSDRDIMAVISEYLPEAVGSWCQECGVKDHELLAASRALLSKYAAPVTAQKADDARDARDAQRLDWLLWKLPGDALRYCLGELSDTSDGMEFRSAIDAAIAQQRKGE